MINHAAYVNIILLLVPYYVVSTGETLLKITDFPFAYAIIGMVFLAFDLDFKDNKIVILLASAGTLATFLAVVDPCGRLIKFWLKKHIESGRQKKYYLLFSKIPYSLRAVDTRSIGIEIDKIVSLMYFAFTMFTLSYLFLYLPEIAPNIMIKSDSGYVFCNNLCLQSSGLLITMSILIILSIVGRKNWADLIKYLGTSSIHQSAINSKNAERTTIENLNKSIELNDWPTANEWATKTEEEISEQLGRKDSILKQITMIYQPMFTEILELLKIQDESVKSGYYSQLPNGVWRNIKSSERYFIINDEQFVSLIDGFYELVDQYNALSEYAYKKAEQIIEEKSSKFYNKNVQTVNILFRNVDDTMISPNMKKCLLQNIFPEEDPTVKSRSIEKIQLVIRKDDGFKTEYLEIKDNLKNFNDLWNDMILVINADPKIIEMKEKFKKISLDKLHVLQTLIEKLKQQKNFY